MPIPSMILRRRRATRLPLPMLTSPKSGASHAQFKHLLSLFGHGMGVPYGRGLGSPYGEPHNEINPARVHSAFLRGRIVHGDRADGGESGRLKQERRPCREPTAAPSSACDSTLDELRSLCGLHSRCSFRCQPDHLVRHSCAMKAPPLSAARRRQSDGNPYRKPLKRLRLAGLAQR